MPLLSVATGYGVVMPMLCKRQRLILLRFSARTEPYPRIPSLPQNRIAPAGIPPPSYNWLFNFLSDWAVVLSATVTLVLAIAAFWAITENRRMRDEVAEQRRKSIQPSLQIGKLSWFYNHLGIEGTDKDAVAPGIELQLSNVGSGSALDLNISATAIVEFVSQAKIEV